MLVLLSSKTSQHKHGISWNGQKHKLWEGGPRRSKVGSSSRTMSQKQAVRTHEGQKSAELKTSWPQKMRLQRAAASAPLTQLGWNKGQRKQKGLDSCIKHRLSRFWNNGVSALMIFDVLLIPARAGHLTMTIFLLMWICADVQALSALEITCNRPSTF